MKHTSDVRTRLLETANNCFKKNGFKETTMRDIAREANVSPGTIYTYFKNKQELFDELNIPEYADYQPHSEKKKQEILSATLILFAEKGYDGTTMDDIATSIGTSKATIYQYFTGKEDLFSQILQNSSFNLYAKELSSDETSQLDIREKIKEIGRSYLSIGDSPERTAIFKTIIRDSSSYPELGTLYYEQGLNPAYNNIIDYINAYCLKNNIPIKNFRQLRYTVITYISSLQSYLLMHSVMKGVPQDIDSETYLETTTDVFFNYLIADGYIEVEAAGIQER